MPLSRGSCSCAPPLPPLVRLALAAWHTIRPSHLQRCRGGIGCFRPSRSAAERIEALRGGLAERIEALCGRQDHAVGHKLLLAVHRFGFS